MKIHTCLIPRRSGFTLIELMIALIVFSIITAIALPNFREHIRQGRRLEARSLLLENAQFMERFFTENNRYNLRADGATPVVLPITASPRNGASLYIISFDANAPISADTFNLRAVPVGGGNMDADACGTYLLSNLGVRANLNNSKSSAECWKS